MPKQNPQPKVPRMGRPPKPDKFDAQVTVPCHQAWIDDVEAYRAAKGYRSVAEVIRDVVSKGVAAQPKGKK